MTALVPTRIECGRCGFVGGGSYRLPRHHCLRRRFDAWLDKRRTRGAV